MLNSARDVLTALSLSSRLSGILLVSKDTIALELGREYGVRNLMVDSDNGQSDAINQAVEFLRKNGVAATLTIPGDVPLLMAHDIDTVCSTLESGASLTIVSNSDGTGSNCIGASSPNLIPYQFGCNSFARHVSSARDAGIEPTVLKLPRLELDIDTESDIAALMNNQPRTATQKFLVASGIGLRCSAPRPSRPSQVGDLPKFALASR
jgi:2-phospho-L-lactate guanylyltransferase